MTHVFFKPEFFEGNRRRLLEKMEADSAAFIFSGWPVCMSGDAFYPFYTDENFFYLTGISDPEVALVLTKDHQGRTAQCLFIHEVDPFKEKWFGCKIRRDEAAACSGIDEVCYYSDWDSRLAGMKPGSLYRDRSLAQHQLVQADKALAAVQAENAGDIAPILGEMRLIKQPAEIEAIRQADALTAKGVQAVFDYLRPDIFEYELQAVFEETIALAGAQGTAFDTIVASGANGPILHYVSNGCRIAEDALVLLDLGARCHHYCGDISRTFPAGGAFYGDQQAIYETVLEAQKQLIGMYRPGETMAHIQQATRELLFEGLVARKVISRDDDIDTYYYHGIGHPLGLATHDIGYGRNQELAEGMVITCEPGLYFADKGIGVRIEDDVLVTAGGPEVLSQQIPKELDEITRL
jgi:Xaa-Pro aminopeptidase